MSSAEYLSNQGKLEESLTELDLALTLCPNYYELIGIRARLKINMRDYEGAITDYNASLKGEYDTTNAFNLGSVYYAIGDYSSGIETYNAILELDDTYHYAHLYKGYCELKLELFEEAIISFTKTIEFNPSSYKAYCNRGVAKMNIGLLDSALLDLDKALELNHSYPDGLNKRGQVKYKLKDYEGAMSDYNYSIVFEKKKESFYYNRAVLKYDLKDVKGALSDLNSAIAINNNTPIFYELRSMVNKDLGKSVESENDRRRFEELSQSLPTQHN
jgi:tetratricopeptide (TPR) repeat protein